MTKPTKWLCTQRRLRSASAVFDVRMKKAWVFSYPLSAQRRLWSVWADAQIRLGIRLAESSLSGWRKPVSLATHWAHSEASDQSGRMPMLNPPRLIWVFAERTFILLVLSWGGSFLHHNVVCHDHDDPWYHHEVSRFSSRVTTDSNMTHYVMWKFVINHDTILVRAKELLWWRRM